MPTVKFAQDGDNDERISIRLLILAEITRATRSVGSLRAGRALGSDTRLAFRGSTFIRGE